MLPETDKELPWPAVTLARGTIHNPNEPRHFMKLKPIAKRVRISRDGRTLAETMNAVRLIEVGGDLYDPPIYVPAEDVVAELVPSETRTVCPLKGEAAYFSVKGDADANDIAWAYPAPYEFASALGGRIAFYPSRVTVEEIPL